jgi:steroid 5-alpha reductase family enzyme
MTPLPVFDLVLICLAVCSLIMIFVWLWSRRIGNAGVVDIFWSFNFPVIGLLLFVLAPAPLPRRLLICSMVVLAGSRLGWHLWVRVTSHLDDEEGRYRQLRKDWGPKPDRVFFWFFQAQALSNVALAIPFFVVTANRQAELSGWEIAGAVLWGVAVIGESAADRQLAKFKRDPANKGKVCAIGLWNYSRHPNYFFEWLMWMAYFVFAMGSPYGWLAIISPAVILYLLLKITGIPMTEEQSIRSRGEAYRAYQRSTSMFIPWPKSRK